MDEVRARRALQRVAYAENWLERLKDDLAAGHRRDALTHLVTAQAELRLLAEQLGAETYLVPVSATAPVDARTGVAGFPARPPLAWALVGVMAFALFLFNGQLLPQQTTRLASGTRTVDSTQLATESAPLSQAALESPLNSPNLIIPAPPAPVFSEPVPVAEPVVVPVAAPRPSTRRPAVTRTPPPAELTPSEPLAPPTTDPGLASVAAPSPTDTNWAALALLAAKRTLAQ